MRSREEIQKSVSSLTKEEEDRILAAAGAAAGASSFPFASLEELLTSPHGAGIATASPVQRAICRLITGVPLGDLAENVDVLTSLGVTSADQLPARPTEVLILAGVRSGKSLIAALAGIWASQTCDVSLLGPGEIPRFSVLSLEKDNARQVTSHLLGVLRKEALRHLRVDSKEMSAWDEILEETDDGVSGSIFLRHPTGRPVEIRVVAGKRAGGSLVSRWSAGCVLDEAPRMVGEDEGVVNYTDARRAVLGRLLPGAQLFSVGSPWQPYGPVFDIVEDYAGPSEDRVLMRAPGPVMNPVWWTVARCEALKRRDPVAYQTDVLSEFADQSTGLYPLALIRSCVRREPLHVEYEPGCEYIAAMDPATRRNAWTFAIASRKGRKKRVVFHKQWQGSPLEPLSPRAVLKEILGYLRKYNLSWAYTDQWSADAIIDIATEEHLDLVAEDWTTENRIKAFTGLAAAMADGTVELPHDLHMEKDLKLVKRRPQGGGVGMSIHLPETSDGRHCDYVPTLAKLFAKWILEESDVPPQRGEPGYDAWKEDEDERREVERLTRANEEWWEHDPYAMEGQEGFTGWPLGRG